jgi:putative phosphonate metabolism protein
MSERFAIYFAPDAGHELTRLGNGWLGRDPLGGPTPPEPSGVDAKALEENTRQARLYGFHATLKAPMRLAEGCFRADLEQAMSDFARSEPPVAIGRLRVAVLAGFLALIPEEQSTQLTDFAASCVTLFDRFRAPMTAEERARRLQSNLSPRQQALLDQYGYPYVLEEFLFHMTLCDRDGEAMQRAAEAWLEPALAEPLWLDRIVLFHQPQSGAPFRRLGDYRLSGN